MKRYIRILLFPMLGLFLIGSALIGINVFKAHAQTPGDAFPDQYFAPYNDVEAGGPSLTSVTQATGVKNYTLAFIINGSGCQAAWGGTVPLDQEQTYLPNLESDIQYIRSQGGDVIVSFGGAAGRELARDCTDVNQLQAQYQAVIDKYNLTHLDFDIEEGAEGETDSVDRRNQALAALQAAANSAGKQLDISYTLPAGPDGLSQDDINLLQNAVSHGVNVSVVNIMTMDYGDSFTGDMGQYAIQAANNLFSQLKNIYPSKSDSQIWAMVGITPMIGQNDTVSEVFTLDDAQSLLSFAQSHQIGRLAMWEVSRDNGSCPGDTNAKDSCSGISQDTYAFTQIFNQFTSSGNGGGNGGGGNGGSGAPVGKTIWLKSTANGNYVSAWLNDANAPLEARSNHVQAWEEFDVVDAGNGNIALKAHANGSYVSAWQSDANSPLEARANHIQGWETFQWIDEGNGTVALQSVGNGSYVSAWQSDANSPLDARSNHVQGWETFQWGQV